jgi:hypothetical protein
MAPFICTATSYVGKKKYFTKQKLNFWLKILVSHARFLVRHIRSGPILMGEPLSCLGLTRDIYIHMGGVVGKDFKTGGTVAFHSQTVGSSYVYWLK